MGGWRDAAPGNQGTLDGSTLRTPASAPFSFAPAAASSSTFPHTGVATRLSPPDVLTGDTASTLDVAERLPNGRLHRRCQYRCF